MPLLSKLGIRLACGSHDAQWLFLGPDLPYPYDHARFQGDEDRPKDPYAPSDQFQGDANKDGKLSYFEAHPEWYPWVDGKRIPGVEQWGGTNFCTSNADATEEFTKNYVQRIDRRRLPRRRRGQLLDARRGQVVPMPRVSSRGDGHRPLPAVGLPFRPAGEEGPAREAAEPIPWKFVSWRTPTWSSRRRRPLPADFDYQTCAATFYPISRCYVHEFDDPKCPRNAKYQRLLHGWLLDPNRHYRGQIEIGEYYNVSRYKSLPLCLMHVMAHDIPYYHKAGARYFQYMHVTTGRWGNKSLTNYQMARQIWDVQTDCEALWSDYFARRYGPAAGVMRQFYESLEKMLANVEPLKGWSSNLASRLQSGAEDLFVEPHLRYRREPGIECDAPTLVEMVEHGRNCRRLIDQAIAMRLPERIKPALPRTSERSPMASAPWPTTTPVSRRFNLAGRAGGRKPGATSTKRNGWPSFCGKTPGRWT